MNSGLRGGVTLLICLMAVFPCGAALTVLGSLAVQAARALGDQAHVSEKLMALWMPAVWAGSGVLGFMSLIHGVDRLVMAQRRIPWHVLFGIMVGIAASGFFSITYPLRTSSAFFLRIVCVAPVGIELLLLLYHLTRYVFRSPPNWAVEPTPPVLSRPLAEKPHQR